MSRGLKTDHSLETTKANLALGYGDVALVGMSIMKCLEYEREKLRAEIRSEVAAGIAAALSEWKEA